MPKSIPGLHHITAISGPAQANVDFYTGPMRQRFVKRTVNFDDPRTYHLYFGNGDAAPGSILTFFPFADAGTGRAGTGMASAFAYAVPEGALDAWMAHFADQGLDFIGPAHRFGAPMITLAEPDGLCVELIEASGPGGQEGFHSVTLWLADPDPTAYLLTDLFGYASVGEETAGGVTRLRLRSPEDAAGSIVDIVRSDASAPGRQGTGTIHHVAFRAETNAIQNAWRDALMAAGHNVTPVIDRQYFNAIYFREPGGVLFEIAIDPPGFAVDEPAATLGRALKLPPRYEPRRADIERRLAPLNVPQWQP